MSPPRQQRRRRSQCSLLLAAFALTPWAWAAAATDPLYRLPIAEPLAANEAVYVCTYLRADASVPAILALGPAGPAKVWLNGIEVYREPSSPPKLAPDTMRVFTRLSAGPNFLLLKLCGPGQASFHARIMGADGKPIPDLAYADPLDVKAACEGISWAHIGPFACHAEACVLDTRFPPEQHPAGPAKDAGSTFRWAPSAKPRPKPSSALLNPGFEFVDTEGRAYAWYTCSGAAETAMVAVEGERSLRIPPSDRPCSREIRSHPFVIDARKSTRLCFDRQVLASAKSGKGVALACWMQWLDRDRRVIAATPVCEVDAGSVQTPNWQHCRSQVLTPPFAAAFARVQFKTWKSQSEVLIDRLVFDSPPQ